MSTATELSHIRDTLAELAFCMVETNGRPALGLLSLLDVLDDSVEAWEGRRQTPHDCYRLGLALGMVGHMSACRVNPQGVLVPLPVEVGDMEDVPDPVAQAVVAVLTVPLA